MMEEGGVRIVRIERLTDEILSKLLEFDADSQRTNFPDDRPNREETERRIRRELAEEPEGMHVVMDGTQVVGCLFLKARANPYRGCRFLDLRNIYLVPSHRGRGISRRLLLRMEEYARAKGCDYLFLGTSARNAVACRLFESFGFRTTRVIMEKDLRRP